MTDPSRPLSRRRFLQLSGAAAVGTALGGGLILESVRDALAARVPAVAVTRAGAPLFAGPGTVDYRLLGTLAKGQRVTPTGLFGDFARVAVASLIGPGGTTIKRTTTGFVLRRDLGRMPTGVPSLTVAKVPWDMRPLVPTSRPMFMPSVGMLLDGHKVYMLLDGTWYAARDIRLTADVGFASHDGIPKTSNSSVNIQNVTATRDPDNPAQLTLQHNGHPSDLGWYLGYNPGADWEFFDRLPLAKGLRAGRVTIDVDGAGRAVSIGLPGGAKRSYRLSVPLFKPGDVLNVALGDSPYTDMTAREVALSLAPRGKREPPVAPYGSLRAHAAKAGITVGTAIDTWRPGPDPRYEEIATSQFDLLVPSGEFNWDWQIRPDATHYDFAGADEQVSFAERHGMKVRGFLLPTGSTAALLPSWLTSPNYTRDQLLEIVHDHIRTVVGRYKGVVSEWGVLGETIFQGRFVPWNFWLTKVGHDFVDKVFAWTHEVDPLARLTYGFTSEEWAEPQASAIHAHIADLRTRRIPVDDVELEMHVFDGAHPPTKSQLLSTMKRLGSLGVGIQIGQMDVNVYTIAGSRDQKLAAQARVYRDALEALLESGVGTSFTTWGIVDSMSWLFMPDVVKETGPAEAPLLFDDDYAPKPAYFAVCDVLKRAAGVA